MATKKKPGGAKSKVKVNRLKVRKQKVVTDKEAKQVKGGALRRYADK